MMRNLFKIVRTCAFLLFAQLTTAQDYHVSKMGDNDNPGTLEAPFLTISKAASLVQESGTVYIHGGIYNETVTPANSGTAGNPIVFEAYQNEKVIISAMEELSDWVLDEGSIYKTTVDWDLGQDNFVLNGGVPCDLARWPNNEDGDPFTLNSMRNDGGSAGDVITNAYLTDSEIPNLPWGNGGSLFFYGDRAGSGWTAWKAFITSSSSGRVNFNLDKDPAWIRTAHPPVDLGDYYLEGIKEALDYQNEWFLDASANTLYIQLPEGAEPADGQIKMRKRNFTIDLSTRNYIEIRNLAVVGGGININGNNNKLYGISSFYGSMTRGVVTDFRTGKQSISIGWDKQNNVIERCEVAYGSGSGIWDSGNGTQIIDCNIHDFDYVGCYDAPLMVRGVDNALVKNNTVYRGGRDALQIISKNSEVAYNNFYESNLIADDCALLYTIGTGLFMKIHHNWFHDSEGRGSLKKAAGIYLDNDAADVDVHHNVVYNTEWSCVQINWNGTNINIYNNTLWDGSAAMDAWHKEGTSFSNVNVWNNLTNMNSLEPQSDKQNNLILSGVDPFTDITNLDFTLVNGATAIDYGKEIAGITDGYAGTAPDAGAYESGVTAWSAGITWDAEDGPAGHGDYGIAEVPINNTTPTGFDEFISQSKMTMYPNPVSNQFKLSNIDDVENVSIYDLSGKRLLYFQSLEVYNITNLNSGMYILTVNTGKEIKSLRFVKK